MTRRRLAAAGLAVAALAYLGWAVASIGFDAGRLREGIPRAATMGAALLRPDFVSHADDLFEGVLESLAIALVATAAGLVLALPMALGAARNVAPAAVYVVSRAVVSGCRAFPEMIVAIFFVVLVGFGPLAGALTLSLATAGFVAKLLAEAIEEIASAPAEAIVATGAGRAQVVLYGVLPQILPRLAGISLYRLDINFRESAILGIVGAGGIGATLNTAFGRYDYATASAVLLLIIGVVLVGETLSDRIRARVT